MKKKIKLVLAFSFILCSPYFNDSNLKADISEHAASIDQEGSGTIVSLNAGAKSGLIVDDLTGGLKEFHYAGLEVLEVNVDYVYIVQVTVSGKIIIRDIHRR